MYKLLRAKRDPHFRVANITADAWRQGTRLAAAPDAAITVAFEREVAAALLAMLREAGADNTTAPN